MTSKVFHVGDDVFGSLVISMLYGIHNFFWFVPLPLGSHPYPLVFFGAPITDSSQSPATGSDMLQVHCLIDKFALMRKAFRIVCAVPSLDVLGFGVT